MSTPAQTAKDRFPDTGYLCGESVLHTVAEFAGVASVDVPLVATGLCSGLSRTCGPCGAVMGAVLAVNLVHGRNAPAKTDAAEQELENCYARVQHVVEGFREEFGSINCYELTQCDFGNPEDKKRFSERQGILRCKEFVGRAVELALEALDN